MPVSILQWNIWCDEDIKNICLFLINHPADIICLQELTINYSKQNIKNVPDYLAKGLVLNYFYKKLPIQSTEG
jgi:hypothetical protein